MTRKVRRAIMVNLVLLGLAVLAGYVVTVACSLLCTLALASAAPRFVVAHHRVRGSYKLAHEALWFCCAVVGAYVAAHIGLGVEPEHQEILLVAALLTVLWINSWEARQRGIAHQILISIFTVAGVLFGFALDAHLRR